MLASRARPANHSYCRLQQACYEFKVSKENPSEASNEKIFILNPRTEPQNGGITGAPTPRAQFNGFSVPYGYMTEELNITEWEFDGESCGFQIKKAGGKIALLPFRIYNVFFISPGPYTHLYEGATKQATASLKAASNHHRHE